MGRARVGRRWFLLTGGLLESLQIPTSRLREQGNKKKKKETNRDPTGQGQKEKKGPERSPTDPPTARAREILSQLGQGPLPPLWVLWGCLGKQASERAAFGADSNAVGVRTESLGAVPPVWCAMSHHDSTAANDMSDRHGHKSNLRPFCCGTPAEDVGGEGWSLEIKSWPTFFSFCPSRRTREFGARGCGGSGTVGS